MKYVFAIIILVCFGCQQSSIYGTDTSEYDKYLEQFNTDLATLGRKPVDFSQVQIIKTERYKNELGADAYCSQVAVKSGGSIVIFVSENMNIYSDTAKAYMLYHELGHCVLGLEHKDGNDLMSPMIGTLAMWRNSFNEQNRLLYLSKALDRSKYR